MTEKHFFQVLYLTAVLNENATYSTKGHLP